MSGIYHQNKEWANVTTPNPAGTASTDLTKLGIDGVNYNVKDADAYHDGDLATVAETGSYSDLSNTPSIPTKTSDLTNDSGFVESNDLATVATSGSYNDLTNKPTIPAAQVNSDWDASSGVAQILHKPALATVATSGSYNDLSNKPTIPTVNNGTLTIQKNGTQVATFSANQSENATANIECATPSDVEGSKIVTGNPLTITDAAGIKAEKIEITFEPKQAGSGTPSPSNIRNISGYTSISANRCGKNLFDIENWLTTASATYTKSVNTYSISNFVTVYNYYMTNGWYQFCKDDEDVVISFSVDSPVMPYLRPVFILYDKNNNEVARSAVGSGSRTVKGKGCKLGLTYSTGSQGTAITLTNFQIEQGTTDPTEYEAYNGRNVTVQFNQTLYGGKLTILQDGSADVLVDSGYLVKNTSAMNNTNDYPGWTNSGIKDLVGSGKNEVVTTFLNVGTKVGYNTNGNFNICWLPVDEYGLSQTQWITLAIDVQITVLLATPFTLHLSPVETLTLLQGINNVWTDGTTLSLTYQPDNAIGQAKGTAQDAMAMVNALASTAVKVIAKKGQYDMSIRDWVDMPDCSLSLDKGTYFIMGWCNLTADNYHSGSTYYRYGCAIADSSNNRLVGNTFKPDSNQAYEASISTCLLETITTDATVRKLKGYMGYSSNSYPIRGGIVAIKIA